VTDSLLRRISPNHRSRSSLRIRYVNRPPSAYKYGYTMITAAEKSLTPQPNTSGNCPPFKSGGARALQLKLPTAMDRCETLSAARCVAVMIMRTSDPLKSLAVWSVEELETPWPPLS
jgi:hypothetical protein